MSADLIVGFAPATAGTGKTLAGSAASSEQAQDALGLFGALLGLEASAEPSAVPGQPLPVRFVFDGEAALDSAAAGLLQLLQPEGVEFAVEAPAEPQPNGDVLLADLIDALVALDTAQANGEPPSPALTQKLAATLDAIAGLLGTTLPVEPAVDPAVLAAATVPGPASDVAPGEIEVLLGLVAEKKPALESQSPLATVSDDIKSAASAVPATPQNALPNAADLPPASMPVIVVGAATSPRIATTPQLPPGPEPAPAATADEVAVRPASDLGLLVDKIGAFAETIEPHSPGLAKRLDALAQKLTSGELSAQTLAALGIGADLSFTDLELDQALQHLLAGPAVKATPAPPAFAAAELKLPETIVLPPKAKAGEPPPPPPAAILATVDTSLEGTPQLTQAPQGPEAADRAEQKPAAANNPADPIKIAATKPKTPVEPATNTPPANQAAAPPQAAIIAGTKAVHAAYQAPVHQVNIPQLAFEMVRQVQAGNSRFQIRLDPPDLGRIDVKLDMDGSGNISARMTVERAETLDLMQRDQRALERALAQAGLDGSKTNLEFSLRQNPFGREDGGDGRGHRSPFGARSGDVANLGELAAEPSQTQYRGSASAGGVNLFV